MHFFPRLMLFAILLLSPTVQAQFDLSAPVTLTLADGTTKQTQFGFAFLQHEGAYQFRIGSHAMAVEEVPKRYTLALMLTKELHVWAGDFTREAIIGFEWNIGKHQLKLLKQPMKPSRPGDYVLLIDSVRYHFIEGRPAQIHFRFDEKGITEIDVEAMLQPKR